MNTQSIINTSVEDVTIDGTLNIDAIVEIINGLKEVAKAAKAEAKEKAKEAKAENDAKQALIGKAYYNSLPIGATFTYTNADGDVIEGRKVETKSKSGSTAACELVNPPANAKTTKRYPKFHKVIVPSDFEMALDEAEEEIA